MNFKKRFKLNLIRHGFWIGFTPHPAYIEAGNIVEIRGELFNVLAVRQNQLRLMKRK